MWFTASSAMFMDAEEAFTSLLKDAEVVDNARTLVEEAEAVLDATIRTDFVDLFDCIASLANGVGYTLDEVLEMNLAKLQSRRDRGKITGSGDDR